MVFVFVYEDSLNVLVGLYQIDHFALNFLLEVMNSLVYGVGRNEVVIG